MTAEVGTCALVRAPVFPDRRLFRQLLSVRSRRGKAAVAWGHGWLRPGRGRTRRASPQGRCSLPGAGLPCV